jgi:phosphatidylserine/phosphatidylglycerophosphate/cardiolipin synthase-like enzyme
MSLVSGRGHYDTVMGRVLAARRSVWIATANLKELLVEGSLTGRTARSRRYHSVLRVFDDMAGRGVELRILHAAYPSRAFRDEFEEHPRLVGGGLELRMCPRVHLKAVIVDGSFLYLGSANWTGAGLGAKGTGKRNFELGFVTNDEALLDEVQAMFERLWRGKECATCRRRDVCEAPLDE